MNESLFYINLALFLIIIINIFIIINKKEHFEIASTPATSATPDTPDMQTTPNTVKIETRPCTLHLTNDDELCDNLSEFYKMSQLQLQILLNKMKVDPKQAVTYDLLKYVKENKNRLPINACKVELNGLREVSKLYNSSNTNLYKNINRSIEYNTETLAGYCLTDVTSYASLDENNIVSLVKTAGNISSNLFYDPSFLTSNTKIEDANNYSQYLPIKMRNNNIQTLLDSSQYFCKDTNVLLDDNIKFLRLHCYLEKDTILKVKKTSVVSYSKSENLFKEALKEDVVATLDKVFGLSYADKKIKYAGLTVPVSIYKTTYNFCKKLESYAMYNIPKFSMEELKIAPKIIKHNIDLISQASTTDSIQPIQPLVNEKIKELFQDMKNINLSLDTYTSNQNDLTLEYQKLKQSTCPSIVDDNKKYVQCMMVMNNVTDNYNMIESDKYYLKEVLEKKRTEYYNFIDAAEKIRTTKFTLDEINDAIQVGAEIDYFKYADLVSNDDCIYVLL